MAFAGVSCHAPERAFGFVPLVTQSVVDLPKRLGNRLTRMLWGIAVFVMMTASSFRSRVTNAASCFAGLNDLPT